MHLYGFRAKHKLTLKHRAAFRILPEIRASANEMGPISQANLNSPFARLPGRTGLPRKKNAFVLGRRGGSLSTHRAVLRLESFQKIQMAKTGMCRMTPRPEGVQGGGAVTVGAGGCPRPGHPTSAGLTSPDRNRPFSTLGKLSTLTSFLRMGRLAIVLPAPRIGEQLPKTVWRPFRAALP